MGERLRNYQPDGQFEETNTHYSSKGGHKERSNFWRRVRSPHRKFPEQTHRELGIIIRRHMFRHPQSGKK